MELMRFGMGFLSFSMMKTVASHKIPMGKMRKPMRNHKVPMYGETIRTETSEPNHFLTANKNDFPDFFLKINRWPPMLINREGPTQSSIAKHWTAGVG